ncbi:mevalonate kinase family protein [Flavilitoribacter nigricans]|uniref:mevalonate kinase n=1 Tax=Flavilitoribacter nigricans (strain ATCC 23147 / DSM 23189 / NBRC 102662 / NCIMB 1420 / SS-2) TaxID=1122177 RepID=A0A2D0N446_FLAN2|nr:mevalonate kinase [Flavilitoribacter nigricans]PHN03274.1 mevalonate kinase [Flavilitoribacter nigricans DSM 23189 = NBRC 102662]
MKKYASKLLLFGEYTIINGSRALAIPYERFAGHWAQAAMPDDRLLAFAEYLEQQAHLRASLDVPAFRHALNENLFFDSNIPIGYGLGSSGALCAAVYDRFAVAPIGRQEVAQFAALRQQFALMESHFHGSSSGTDPLICYLGYPVVIRAEGAIDRVDLPNLQDLPFPFFLLDTGLPRSTGPLVNTYLANCEKADYAERISRTLTPEVNALIEAFLTGNWQKVGEGMRTVSVFQYEHFSEMIPSDLRAVWQQGLDSGAYTLKLCGAGGGGFLLGTAKDQAALDRLARTHTCIPLW